MCFAIAAYLSSPVADHATPAERRAADVRGHAGAKLRREIGEISGAFVAPVLLLRAGATV